MPTSTDHRWWRDAVIYQVYVRSFADSDGDGLGDLPGAAARLDHLAALGVDAVWLTPFYPSPLADGGYDIADHCDVDPRLGTLADAETLIVRAHERGLRVLIDLVPNHTSDRHPWFRAALADGPDSPARARYVFRDGKGPDGALPPTAWRAKFGGPAWHRVPDGQWYLHMFAPEQPDLNWAEPSVRTEFSRILRFWLDLGVDGFRIDVANGLAKDLADPLRDLGPSNDLRIINQHPDHPLEDREEVHEIYRDWRRLLDTYRPPRAAVAEAWLPHPRRARYTRPDELHQAFNFDFLTTPWSGTAFRSVIDASLAADGEHGAATTWVLSNHDVVRHRSRYALPPGADSDTWLLAPGGGTEGADGADDALGRRRGRAGTLLMLALPGSAYLYQGDELGLPEVADLPADALRDPTWERSGHTRKGRDGCRVPLPWTPTGPSYGFGPGPAWLPQPPTWADLSVAAQTGAPGSTLELVRTALRLRRTHGGDGTLRWLDQGDPAQLLAFRHSRGLVCAVNLGSRPQPLPPGELLLTSDPLTDGLLPPDTAAWLRSPDS
ncbi:glycoside hydrolase family 13 protein [Peterkaempfera bronchialis]|uniref:glycoside hydrolase family 13 protein n=1 Tax=Peterkaempfera bronchialis TaxID=2126346 RepID=UPI003C2AE140